MQVRNYKILVGITFILTLFVNILANTLPINDVTTAQVSDKYTTLFTPADFTFAIWGVIYLLLTIFVIYQFINRSSQLIHKLRAPFIVVNLGNVAWIFSWHYEHLFVSVLMLIIIIWALIYIYIQIQKFREKHDSARVLFLVSVPFSIYLAWICVALTAAVASFLSAHMSMFVFTGAVWMAILITIITLLTTYVLWRYGDIFFATVVMWAYVGIGAASLDLPIIISLVLGGITSILINLLINRNVILKRLLYTQWTSKK